MTTHKFRESPLWAHYSETRVTKESALDLTDFKTNGVTHKITFWDPSVAGVRYVKSLIYHIATHLSDENLARLRNIPEREVGSPISLRCRDEFMCLDYLLSVHELEFLAANLRLDGARVLEIGAGYGRTCHSMLSNHDVASYHIVDLPNMLTLSRAYLTRVLPAEKRERVHFVSIDEATDLFEESRHEASRFDLAINIDSMAEMSPETVSNYLAEIDRTCRHLYVANPVGKFMDKSLDNHNDGAEVVNMAMHTGPLREVLDINDMAEVEKRIPQYLDAYRPGPAWEPIAVAPHLVLGHFKQALYRKN